VERAVATLAAGMVAAMDLVHQLAAVVVVQLIFVATCST
jgi:hypothetical protein